MEQSCGKELRPQELQIPCLTAIETVKPSSTGSVLPEHSSPNQHQQKLWRPPSRLSQPIVKLETPRMQPRSNIGVKDGTPKKQKQCNCKHSLCLKLYCECFASGTYCDGCNCINCNNNAENEVSRKNAIELILDRNPNAFRPKVANNRDSVQDSKEDSTVGKHNKGCHCKKSWCLKKYCECYQASIPCSDNCKCVDCKNSEGNSPFLKDRGNSLNMQQAAANAAITRAVGSSGYGSAPTFKKRKNDVSFGTTPRGPFTHKLDQYAKANHLETSPDIPSSCLPFPCVNSAINGSSNSMFRSILADVLHPQDVKKLCSLLVVESGQAAKAFAEKKSAIEKQAERDRKECSPALSTQEREDSQKISDVLETALCDRSSRTQDDTTRAIGSESDGDDTQTDRHHSPGTLALMCDEQDVMFMENTSPDGVLDRGKNTPISFPYEKDIAELYMEQERLVLTKLRDCMQWIITRGRIKEEKYTASRTRTEVRKAELSGNIIASAFAQASTEDRIPVQSTLCMLVKSEPTLLESELF